MRMKIKTIGDAVREYRKSAKLSQEDVAEALGKAISQVSRKERGEIEFSHSELEIIARKLSTTVSELYKAVETGVIDKRRAAWNGAYSMLTPSEVDAALSFVLPKSRKSRKSR